MHNSWKHKMMQKSPHELLTRTNPQINVQLIKENVLAAVNLLWELVNARQTTQSYLEHIQKAKDNKTLWLFTEGQQVWLEGKNLSIKESLSWKCDVMVTGNCYWWLICLYLFHSMDFYLILSAFRTIYYFLSPFTFTGSQRNIVVVAVLPI